MINKLKLFAVGLLGAIAAVSANAAPAPTTALLQTVNVALTVYSQGSSSTVHGITRNNVAVSTLTTKQLITALTGSYANGDLLVRSLPLTNVTATNFTTNSFTNFVFLTNSGVITTNPVVTNSISTNVSTTLTNTSAVFEVIHGNTVVTVISNSALASFGTLIDGLTNAANTHGEVIRANGTIASGQSFSIRDLEVVVSNGWNLNLQGFVRTTTVPVLVGTVKDGTVFYSSDSTWAVNGTGFNGVVTNNTPAVIDGTVTVRFFKQFKF